MNVKKRWFAGLPCVLCAAFLCLSAHAGGKIVIGKGGNREVDPGFKVEKFDVNPREIVSVDVGGGIARVSGIKEGKCILKLIGAGNLEDAFEVVVGSDLQRIMRDLQQRLAGQVTGIEFTRYDDYILVSGDVNNPDEWFQLKRIVAEDSFKNIVKDDTKFRIQADVKNRFYNQLRDAGFQIVTDGSNAPEGTLRVRDEYDYNTVTISGTVFSEGRLASLRQIIAEQSWLRLAGASVEPEERWKPVCKLNVSLDQRLLHMDVVLIGYNENSDKQYGTKQRPEISMTFKSFWDLIAGHAKNDAFRIDANLESVLDFLKANDITRYSIGGYMRFRCNDSTENKLDIGGTLNLKMKSATAEGAPTEDFKTIDYGFTVTKSEASLVSANAVHLKLNIEQKDWKLMGGGMDEGYEIIRRTYNAVVDCPLGKTMVLSGYRRFEQNTDPSSGFPILRNVPGLSWFAAHENDTSSDMKIMMLVSVRAVRPDEPEHQNASLPYEETKNLTAEVQIDNNDRFQKRKEEKWSGWLYWLNWFTP